MEQLAAIENADREKKSFDKHVMQHEFLHKNNELSSVVAERHQLMKNEKQKERFNYFPFIGSE